MRKYETIFILDDQGLEDGGKSFADHLEIIMKELDGELLETHEMGHRQFAHPIGKKTAGIYKYLSATIHAIITGLKEGRIERYIHKISPESTFFPFFHSIKIPLPKAIVTITINAYSHLGTITPS